ncbi:MAG: tyrosine-type recombinase/integrase [Peptostreptococcaceae bacterium]|nr:tyrosine-type recombinase/integrase [Peptostreptococcaceae bacterium]
MANKKISPITRTFTFDGKRYYVRGNSESDCAVKKAMKLRDLEEGKVIISNKTTVNDWAKFCFETYKNNLEGRSRRDWWNRLEKNVLREIGTMQLKHVKPLHCQHVMNNLQGKSKSHINKIYQSMNFIFDKALGDDLILKNPVTRVEKPEGTVTTRRAITSSERTQILKLCKTHRANIWIKLMLYCGLRPYETSLIQGLDIKDINIAVKYDNFTDWLNEYINSDRYIDAPLSDLMLAFENEKDIESSKVIHTLHIRGTKTKNADRIVPIPEALYHELPNIGPFEYLCRDSNGKQLTEYTYNNLWDGFKLQLAKQMGGNIIKSKVVGINPIASDLTPYCFRHTYCTDLQSAGVPINVARELMGHSTIELTSRIYTHWSEVSFVAAANQISAFQKGATLGATLIHPKTPQNTPYGKKQA